MAAAHVVHRQVVHEAIRLDDRDEAENHEDYAETVDAEDVPHGEDDEGDTLLLGADRSSRQNMASPQKGGALVGAHVLEDILQSHRPGAVRGFLLGVVAAEGADNFPVALHRRAAE